MQTLTHSPNSPAQTKGLLIRWASVYDRVVDVLTLGQAQRLRNMTLDQALAQTRREPAGCRLRHRRRDHPRQETRRAAWESRGN